MNQAYDKPSCAVCGEALSFRHSGGSGIAIDCNNEDCPSKRRASVQGAHGYLPFPDGTIAWWEHEEAWLAYAKRFGTEQSAERMNERGGFGFMELCSFLGRPPSTWMRDEKEGAK